MLQFKKATERVSTLKSIGTVASFTGVGGYQELSNTKNFKGTMKSNGKLSNVTIKLVNKDGDYEYVNCSAPVSAWLRESKNEAELKERIGELALLQILELPQTITDENDPNFGQPVMVVDEVTGEEKPLVIHSISFTGGQDMSSTRVSITEEMLNKEVAKIAISFEDLLAL